MANLYQDELTIPNFYKYSEDFGKPEEIANRIAKSTTVYVGNLKSTTKEEQIYDIFKACGDIKRVILGMFEKTIHFVFLALYSAKIHIIIGSIT